MGDTNEDFTKNRAVLAMKLSINEIVKIKHFNSRRDKMKQRVSDLKDMNF